MANPFPLPPENLSGLGGLVSYANTLTEGFFGTGILIVIAIISFISAKNYSPDKAAGFAGFFSLMVAILLRFMNLINDGVLYITIVLFVGTMIWIYLTREQETV